MTTWEVLEPKMLEAVREVCVMNPDPSHDLSHVARVVRMAKRLASAEGASLEVVVPAAYLHDFEFIAKTDARRSIASKLSAQKAVSFLRNYSYPEKFLADIAHAIESHSYSAKISATTLEAKVVQDADRLDGLGAIGVARCFGLSGLIKRDFYSLNDPFCEIRQPDDQLNSLDHFFTKLLKVPELLHTASARAEAKERTSFMFEFLRQLRNEI